MMQLPDSFISALEILSEKLKDTDYCIRGTTSLISQGIDMNTDDVDILTDKINALKCNDLLKKYIVEPVSYKESPKFKSYYGKFLIESVPVEVMGDWEIYDSKKGWSTKFNADERIKIAVANFDLFVTPVTLELKMFAHMGRWSAYQKIKSQLPRQVNQPTLF